MDSKVIHHIIFFTVIAVGLSSCARIVWDKPGASQQDYAVDSYNCEKDMRQSGYYGGGLVGAINASDFESRCMVAHGWTQHKQ